VSHTPGPWAVGYTDDKRAFVNAAGVTVCKCDQGGDDGEVLADPRANARLIAAAPELLAAVSYTLDRIQEDPNLRYYAGYSTQVFYLLVRAEAAVLGKSVEDVEKTRRRDLQPAYRKTEPEVLRLRDQLDELRRECGR